MKTKQNYINPEMVITLFDNYEVVTASTPVYTEEEDKLIELPFVPITPKSY